MASCKPTLDYPLWAATAALSLVLLLWIDQGLHRTESSAGASSFALFIVLSLHSIIAGMALGVEAHPMQAMAILIAILAHKGSAAFALGLRTQSEHYWRRMLGFVVMTPLGLPLAPHWLRLLKVALRVILKQFLTPSPRAPSFTSLFSRFYLAK